MNEIPDVLKPLIETHEGDGSPVAVCDPGCGKTFRFGVLWRIKLRGKPAELGIMRGVCWCAYCGTIVGEDECGRPYRIRHSRVVEALEHRDRALEWLATECKLLIEPRVHSVEQIVAGALAATKEAPDGHDAAAGA